MTEEENEIPSTPLAADVEEILKVMTESLPIKLLSPLGPELTKLFQKKEEPSAAKKADGLKKRRIGSVMHAIEKTTPPASASKIAPTASAEATAEANTSGEAAAAIGDASPPGGCWPGPRPPLLAPPLLAPLVSIAAALPWWLLAFMCCLTAAAFLAAAQPSLFSFIHCGDDWGGLLVLVGLR